MPERTIKASVLLSVQEHAMLNKLSAKEDVKDTQLLRRLIRTEYQRQFGSEAPTVTEPTVRGLITDMVAPAHLFVSNIAKRMNVATDDLMAVVRRMKRKGLVTPLTGPGPEVTPEWMGKSRALADALALAQEKGFDLDETIGPDSDENVSDVRKAGQR